MSKPFKTETRGSIPLANDRPQGPSIRKPFQFRRCDLIPSGRYLAYLEDITIYPGLGDMEAVMMWLRVESPTHAGAELDWTSSTASVAGLGNFMTAMARCGVNVLCGPDLETELEGLFGATLEIEFENYDDDGYLVTILGRVDLPGEEPPGEGTTPYPPERLQPLLSVDGATTAPRLTAPPA